LSYLECELHAFIALCRPRRLGHINSDCQSVPILHKQMPGIVELCFLPVSFLTQQRVRIGRRLMSVIRAFLTVKVYRRIPRIIWRMLILIVCLLETLKPGRRFNESPIDCEMLVAEQFIFSRLLEYSFEKCPGYVSLQQPLLILAERCWTPDVVVHGQSHEPAE